MGALRHASFLPARRLSAGKPPGNRAAPLPCRRPPDRGTHVPGSRPGGTVLNQLHLRCLRPDEAEAAARVHRAAFDERLPWLRGLHARDEDHRFYRDVVFRECAVWGAFDAATLLGIVAFRPGWIDQLYVLPEAQGRGAGTMLLDLARRASPHLSLWTFRRNARARRFYERRGFVAVAETDGARNEEREPDVLYRWSTPGDPAAGGGAEGA